MNSQVQKLGIILAENAIDVEGFANCLGITEAQAEAICAGKKKLTASLARQIEQTFSKPAQWLSIDTVGDQQGSSYDLFG